MIRNQHLEGEGKLQSDKLFSEDHLNAHQHEKKLKNHQKTKSHNETSKEINQPKQEKEEQRIVEVASETKKGKRTGTTRHTPQAMVEDQNLGGTVRNDIKLSGFVQQPQLTGRHPQSNSQGGNLNSCLDAGDINTALRDINNTPSFTVVDAFLFFRLRTGLSTPESFEHTIRDLCSQSVYVAVPVHTRHHWALLVLHNLRKEKRLEGRLYDSCPSHETNRDILKAFKGAGIHLSLQRAQCYRQRAYSNECGLFAVFFTATLSEHLTNNPSQKTQVLVSSVSRSLPNIGKGYLSLHNWRRLLKTKTALQIITEGGASSEVARNSPRQNLAHHSAWQTRKGDKEARSDSVVRKVQQNADRLERKATGAKCTPAGGTMPVGDYVNVESNELLDAVSVLQIAKERLQTSHDYLRYNTMMCGFDLDTLITKTPNKSPFSIISVISQCPATPPFLKPIHIGPSESGHFVLLAVPASGPALLFDSAPGYLPGAARAAASTLTTRPIELRCLKQGTSECGFVVVSVARSLMSNTAHFESTPGSSRALLASELLRLRQTEFDIALADLQRICTLDPSKLDHIPPPLLSLLQAPPSKKFDPAKHPASSTAPTTKSTTADAQAEKIQRTHQPYAETVFRHNPYSTTILGTTKTVQQATSLHTKIVGHEEQLDLTPTIHNATSDGRIGSDSNPSYPEAKPGSTPQQIGRLTHGAVRRVIGTLSVGTYFETSWSSNGEQGKWFGSIARQGYPGIPPQAYFSHELCSRCGEWHASDDTSMMWDVPAKGVSYHTFQTVESPPITTSNCEHRYMDSKDSALSTALDSSPDSDQTNDAPTAQPPQPETPVPAEFEPLAVQHYVPCSQLRGDAIYRHHIFHDKPPHVHTVSWNRVSYHTHRSRIRWLNTLRAIPQTLHRTPFDSAVLETITTLAKKRRWKPSTFSKALSDVAAACRSLTLYTNASSSIDLESSVLFTEAMRRARSLAESTIPKETRPLLDHTLLLPLFTAPYPRALFCLCWHSAARVGDARQLRKEDIEFLSPDATGTAPVNVRITFRRGKGFAFWGLYSIVCKIPRQEAQKISTCMDSRLPNENIFSLEDQKFLTKILKSRGFEARSIRKGRLITLARAGCSDSDIMALSGHKKLSTLRKYIGNEGLNDAAAAERRATQETIRSPLQSSPRHGNEELDPTTGGDFQPVMGAFANLPQHGGQRFLPPPRFFPEKAPSNEQLGISKDLIPPGAELHVKSIVPLTDHALINLIPALCSNSTIVTTYRHFLRYLHDPSIYPISPTPLRTIPISRSFSNADLDQLMSLGKIQVFDGTPRGFVNAFTVQHKGKRRPIFEPSSNAILKSTEIFKLHYPSRLSRRVVHSHAALFDFATYYDQFELHPSVREQYVFRAMHHGALRTFALTRLPMGASPSAALAQLTTWCVTHDLIRQGNIIGHTMIDNVRFCGPRESVLAVAQSFTDICRTVGLQFNNEETGFYGEGIGPCEYIFLGERYQLNSTQPLVGNTEKNLTKATNGISALSDRKTPYTYRNFAALVGLLFFLAHTVNFNLSKVFNLLRTYRAIFSAVTTGTTVGWDDELQFISPGAMFDIAQLHEAVKASVPLYSPTTTKTQPLTTIFVDSCAEGWGAVIDSKGSQSTVSQSFSPTEYPVTRFSANSEPLGIYNLLQFLLANKKLQGRVVVFTDHEAVVSGAFDPTTGFKGFSRNFYLNRLYLLVQEIQTTARVTFEYIKGVENPADVVSRTTKSRMIVCESSIFKIPAIQFAEKSFPEGGDFSQHHTPITNETGVQKANQQSQANGQ